MSNDIRRKGRTSQSAAIAAASILELHLFTRSAQAQEATGDVSAFQDIASVDGVASVETLDDGRVEITMEDGSVLMVPAGEVQILNGTVFVSDSFLIAQGLTASPSNNTVLLLTLGAVGAAVAVNALESSGDSDDDVAPPVATPPPPPPPMPPVFTSSATADVAENQTDAYRAVATDADSDTLSYSLSGTDASRFMIDAATGEVRFIEAPDFEAPGDADADNVYDIIVTASDGANTAERTVAIMVTDENEAPIFTSDAAVSVAENQTTAYAAVATDADGNDLSYNLSGTDAALFMIDAATGEVSFIEAPDFEAPGDADGDNVYDIVVTASDGTNSTDQTVAITVTDENEQPIFTSDAAVSVAENQTAAYTALATDADGDDLSYNLSGTDAARFMIDATTGEVRFIEAPDFEAPGDADGDNVYDIVVTASDGTNSADQTVAITVTNENDNAPSFTSDAAVSVAENQTVAYTALATDADGDDLSYNLSGTDAALFMIDAATGEVRFIEAPDFENPGDADEDNIYDIVVTASDGTNSTDQTVAITVTDENEPPIFTSDAAVSVAENQAVAYTALATDADGDDLSYNLSGTDAALFMIDATTGEVRFIEAPDFEAPGDADGDNVYDIVVTASDGTNSTDQTVAITVTDENEAPIFTSDAAVSVAENQTAAYAAVATDVDGDDLSYNLSGTDAALFMIDAATGEVSFIEAPDFENPGDADGDNVYDIVVTASDGTNSNDQAVAITVTDEADISAFERLLDNPEEASVADFDAAGIERVNALTLDATRGLLQAVGENDPATLASLTPQQVQAITDIARDHIVSISGPEDAGIYDSGEFTLGSNPAIVSVEAGSFIVALDYDGDGETDHIANIEFDADYQVQRVERDFGADNAPDDPPDAVEVVERPDDRTVQITYDIQGDGDTDRIETYTLDESGDRIQIDVDTDADGNTDRVESYEVDADGNRIQTDFDDDADGATDRIEISTYDESGNRVQTDFDDDADGTIDRTEDIADIAPVFTSPATANVAENRTEAYTAIATDADSDALTYSLSGTDAARFTIDPDTGVVSFITPPDFERPGDDGRNNVYDITVTASDGDNSTDQNVAIMVTNVFDPINVAPVFTSPAAADVAENQTAVVYTAVATDADGDTLSYSLSGTDAALFTINPATGVVSFIEAPDFENPGDADGDNVYDIVVTASDGANSTNQAVAITVTDANEVGNAPIFTSDAAVSVAENQTVAYTALATDADGDDLSYSLSGTDAALFTIDPATGVVGFIAPPDFEAPGDNGGDNVYDITVTASDGANSTDQAVAITVTDVDDDTNAAPVFTSPAAIDVAENQTAVYTAQATDADGEALTYSLSGTDAALFTLDPATGAVSFIAPPDFENPDDAGGDNVYDITVTASDDDSSTNQDVAITVTDVNDNAPVFTSSDSASAAENQTSAYTAMAADADAGDMVSYRLSGGADVALFTIDEMTGVVSFMSAPDFENEGDADTNNVYEITVTASDGTRETSHAVAITVTDVLEDGNAPNFTSPGSASVEENQTMAYTAMATDADGDDLSYSLSGTDATLFTIDPATGVVSFIASPDFEDPGDIGGDNVYDIVVTATDGPNRTNQPVAITVTNVNDNAPVFTSPATANVEENRTAAYTAVAADADGDVLSYSLSGTDAARFTINETTGEVSFNEAPDAENPDDANGDNVYDIIVTASDGTTANDIDQAVAITVTGVNDNAPVFTSPATASVAESETFTFAYTAVAMDADGDPLTYSLSGTDAGLFTIDPATGVVSFNEAPDAENPDDANGDNVYEFIVTASDGTTVNDIDQAVAITVTGVNDNAPVFTSPDSASAAENQTAAYTAEATDADGDPLTYSLSGTDAGLFTIDPATGVVSFNNPPDFEAPSDANGDNVYDIIVTASDNTGGTPDTNQAVTITVTDVNEGGANAPPVFSSPASVSVAENQTVAYTALATDADGDPLTYSLSGTDADLFTIDPATGVVSFNEAPDAENPGDDDGDNVYDIIVTASDNTEGTTDTNQVVAITVTNVNDNAPSFTSDAAVSVAENQTVAYTALATDGDGDPLTYSLSGTDAGLFTIDPATGVVSFNEAPDVEAPSDANGDNVYEIIVTASDNTGGTTDTNQAVAITVTGVNDNAPVFTSPATASVAESETLAYTAVATDGDGDPLTYSLSGTDADLFTIDPATGVVSFNEAPDAENPDDANGDNVYDIVVTASDNTGGTPDTNQAVTITVTDVNEGGANVAPVFSSPASVSVAENQTVAYTALATDADGDPLTYSLSGTDADLFTIDPATGVVSFNEAPDAENPGDDDGDNVYDIIVTASDNTEGTTDTNQAVAITVTNVNDNAPSFTSDAAVSVAENQTVAYTALATDGDGDPLTYSLSGTDAGLFTIDPATGVVSFNEAPDVEAPSDANGDNVYEIIVTASDNTGGTTDTNQAVAITVTGVNDNAPVFTSPATASVAESETLAYTAVATDGDGDPLTYSLSGTDAGLFTIDPATGVVSFNEAPDAENPDDANGDNVYNIVVTASDNTGGTTDTTQAVAITVTGVNDNAPVFTSPATASVAESETLAYTALAMDGDGDPLTYGLSGTDAGLFTIDPATGVVSFSEAPDVENPDDANGDNVYDIVVTASDNTGGTPDTNQAVAITVTGVNDNAPAFTSPDSASVAENQTLAYTAMAADADAGDVVSYSLSGGADAALFTIDADTGEVRFNEAPDVEAPSDANGDNVYDIIVTASDNTAGTADTDQAVAITVTGVNDNTPVFTSLATANVEENQTEAYTAVAMDADGMTPTYGLSGTDAALFTIDPNTGVVSFLVAPDFENPGDADGDNVYNIDITATDGTRDGTQAVTITVTDVNEGPVPSRLIDLSMLDDSNGFTLSGIDAFDFSGDSVSSAGDVNGDGYDDLIIGANGTNVGENNSAGETYVVYGGPAGTAFSLDRSALDGTNGFTVTGISQYDNSGISVSSAGDVNGDGYDDLIIGAHRADPGGTSNAGETYVVYGGASAPGTAGVLALSALDGTNGFILNGIDAGDESGRSVSSAGDVNGDGYDDLIIGARRADPGGESAGESYVVYGGASAPGTGGVLALSALDGTNGFTLNGIDEEDRSGVSVSSAGDINGDGYDDLIIGARRADPGGNERAGESYVVYGGASAPGTGGVLALSALDGTNGFTLNGIDERDEAGHSVSSAGDVNGDGYDDLIIGARYGDPNENDSGETYVVYGGASAPGTAGVLALSALNGSNGFTLNGIDAGDDSGFSVSSAGDVNGDGYDDLIIGARDADPNVRDSGETYVVYGGASAPGTGGVLELSALDGTNGFTLNGIDADDRSGTSVSSAGDINGDGYDDLIIGAYGADLGENINVGETYVVYGGATGTESTAPVTAQGTAAADNFTGNGGADSFTGIATGDVVRGGAGDDSISVTALDFADIDGGTGRDSLVLAGADLSLDLTGAGNGGVDSVEIFDLSGTGGDTLVLDALAVFDLTEERDGGMATLDVLGDANDRVDLSGGNFTLSGTATEDGTTYNVYQDGNAEVRVQNGVVVTLVPAAANTPPVFTSPDSASVAENQSAATVVYTAVATDADGDALSYSLSGTDEALFTINPATGVVTFLIPPDFEAPGDAGGDNVYDIVVTASDDTNSAEQAVAITVTNVNDSRPSFTPPGPVSVDVEENQTAVYTAVATDADGDLLTYSLSGTDEALFTIDPNTGVVSFLVAPDFEMPGDDDGDNVYNIDVMATDGTRDRTQAVTITVTDVDEGGANAPPVFTSDAAASVAENETSAYTAVATDADGDSLTYSLSGTDAALFTIDSNTGVVSFTAAPDFEAPGDVGGDNVYNITVTASDETNETTRDVAITVTDANDNAPAFTSPDSASVAENQTLAYIASATDADGDTLSYSLSGTDEALFTIDANTGEVRFNEAPDFEAPGSADGDNVYEIIVTASDDTAGTTDTDQAVAITVTDANDAPIFTSPASASVAENQTSAYTAMATDADGESLSYSLSGTDEALFTIDLNSGVVSFNNAPDFEAPGDDDGDNVYDITVTASDGANSTDQTVAITVTDANDNIPVFGSPTTASVAENQRLAYTTEATDGDGDTLTYSLSGMDEALFTIDAMTGVVSFIDAPDFENPADAGGDNVYNIIVTASDGDNSTEHEVAITVTDEEEVGSAPAFTSPGSANVEESQTMAYTAMATDTDAGDTVSYSLSGGADMALFTINAMTGVVSFIDAPDFENPNDAGGDNVYDITVTATDGTNETTQDVAITVTNVNDNDPVFNSPTTADVAENQTVAYTAMAADADASDTVNYSLSGGADMALFTIDATGVVSFIDAPDFENPNDADSNNVYNITVTATDGTNETTQDVAITVTNVNDNDPIFTSDATADVAENERSAYTAAATDADGDSLTYSLSGTDEDLFTINPTTGDVSFIVLPDFEMPGDAGSDNVYDIIVTASDGADETTQAVAITVTNINDSRPSFTPPGPVSVDVEENQTAVYTAVVTDADGDPLTYSLSGADAVLFTIDPNTGVVSFLVAPDFEMPGDAGGDNVYNIGVMATDGTRGRTQAVTITVTDVNDNAPIFTSPATANVEENQTAAYTAQATDAEGDALSYSLSGTDAGLFTIDPATGEVSFNEAPDFESPNDANGDNVYNIIVTASDNTEGTTDTNQAVAITVTGLNDNAPVFTSPGTASVMENQTAAYTAQAMDADGMTPTYSLSGTDAALFTIDPATGVVSFIAPPDFEAPGDNGGDNVYDITVTASDGANSTDQTVAITVTDVEDGPLALINAYDGTGTPLTVADYAAAGVAVFERDLAGTNAVVAAANGGGINLTLAYLENLVELADDYIRPETMAVTVTFNTPTFTITEDVDGNGSPDRISAVTVDADGNVVSASVDFDADGTAERTVSYTLDANGNATMAQFDDNAAAADGFERSETRTYDENGNATFVQFDDNPDPAAANSFERTETRTYDANGNATFVQFDDDADGTVDRTAALTRDSFGQITLAEFDEDDDGNVDRTVSQTFNDLGQITRRDFDTDNDGTADRSDAATFNNLGQVEFRGFDDDGDETTDRTEAQTFNALGQVTGRMLDDDADGTVDQTITQTFNDLWQITRLAVDENNDGTVDRSSTRMYNDLGQLALLQADLDNDGNFDRIDTYNALEQIALRQFDTNDDGTIDRTEALTYNAQGQVTRREFDNDNDTDIDQSQTRVYNAEGLLERVDADFDNDGNIDRADTYNALGQITSQAFDTNDDGTVDRTEALTYNAQGQVTRREFDNDGDGDIDQSQTRAYSAEGLLERVDADLDNDGNIDRADTYNAQGRIISQAFDTDDDGTVDRTDTFNDQGQLTRREFDNDGDGTTDQSQTRTYSAGQLERVDADLDNDGTVDRADTYNAQGQIISQAFDTDDDGNVNRRDTFNAQGQLTRREVDDNDNGTFDRIRSQEFNGEGLLARVEIDNNADGTADRIEIYTYNEDGDLVRTDFDDDADGTIDRTDPPVVANTPPVFTSPASVRLAENEAEAYTAVATDADGDSLTYSLSGVDAGLFTINPTTGVVSFNNAPNFESPGSATDDNDYNIIVTASDGASDAERAVTITVTDVVNEGSVSSPLTDLSMLDGSNGFTVHGIGSGSAIGYSVSSAGDVNGDGYDDLIISGEGNGTTGETFVVYGASVPGTDGVLALSGLDGSNGFRLNGIDEYDLAGFSVSSAGDLNGDGYDDLIIGAHGAGSMPPAPGDYDRIAGPGETYVVYGGASAPGSGGVLALSALDGSNGFRLDGIDGGDDAGYSVSSAGDVNGDGYDDLIIGANQADPNGSRSGETYVVYGGASAPDTAGVLALSALDGSNGFRLDGIERADRAGYSVSSAGDVNGDGYDDLIIGANRADPNGNGDAGETYVVYGSASAPGTEGVLALSALDGSNGFRLDGIDGGDFSGYSVSSAEDVNGDGYDDLIISANLADPGGDSNAGETYVVYGGANAPGSGGVLALSALDGTNGFILNGIDADDRSGTSVSSAGDVNGDGYDDLIIGAYRADPGGDVDAGETYVVYGGATAPGSGGVLALSALDGTNGFILNGIDVNDYSGRSVSSAGDVNGDGYDDLIIGAPEAEPVGVGNNSGETYVVYGGATGTESTVAITAQGTVAADNFTGNAGADSFTGIATGDVVRGGAGDDSISVTALDFADIDGGTGRDTLVLAGSNLSLDLTGAGNGGVDSVEVFDLSGTGANTLVLDALAVFDLTEERDGGMATLDVLGDANDRVDLSGGNFTSNGTATEDGTTYNVYQDGNAEVRVQNGVVVTLVPAAANTPPVFTSPASVSVAENQTSAYTAAATDADGDSLTYSLSGTDAALFTINATTGVVSFNNPPDFESPGSGTGDNDYDITVTASDGTSDTERAVTITVTDVDEGGANAPPVFTSPASVSVAENQTSAYTAVATDADGDSLAYSLSGTDAALFTINATTGVVSFNNPPDFESPGSGTGDNVYDIIVTASDGTSDTERAVTITVTDVVNEGSVSSPLTDLSMLDGSNGFTVHGIGDGSAIGYSVSSAGDVNGDGYDDLIISGEGNGTTGEAFVVYGASVPGTDGVLALSGLDGSNGFRLNGIDEFDRAGYSLSSAGDVNGDGYDDLIIGAHGAGSMPPALGDYDRIAGPGETYVVYGGASAPGSGGVLALSALDGSNGFRLDGIDGGDDAGYSVSSAGDVNGDGYDDLIIGANQADPNGSGSGETYVVYGGASAPDTAGVLALSALDGSNGFRLDGIDRGDRAGYSVSSAGDVNGDGYDDLIIGAYEADPGGNGNAGETYVVYGGASAPGTDGVLALSALDGSNGFRLDGIDGNDRSGASVSSAGDVNGDGYDDLIIGANQADPGGRDLAGETYLVYGGASAPGSGGVLALSALDGTNGFILNGVDPSDRSSRSVSSAGDVNGDGYDDLIIGAYGADPGGNSGAGESYVVYGGASAPGTGGVLALSALDGTNGFTLNGINADDRAGISVSAAGDVNGDGYDDLIIGADEADVGVNGNAGETYVVYGGATGTESTVAVTAAGTAAVDNFTGNAGADSFTGIATGDVVRGGAGDDSISVTALDFADIDGGTGQDTLVLAGADLSLDLTGAGNGGVDSVEVFDLTGTGANTLVLDVQAVFDLTEERTGGMATLDVVGDANDTVDLSGGNFALSGRATEDGTTYNVFNDGNVELRIQNGVLVTLGTTSSGLLSEEPVFEDLSVRDSIPDMQDTGEDAVVLMPLPVTALAPMAAPVFAGDKQLQNDLAMILQDMEVFADPVNNGDTDMDGF